MTVEEGRAADLAVRRAAFPQARPAPPHSAAPPKCCPPLRRAKAAAAAEARAVAAAEKLLHDHAWGQMDHDRDSWPPRGVWSVPSDATSSDDGSDGSEMARRIDMVFSQPEAKRAKRDVDRAD